MKPRPHTAVVGAGIGGLAAAIDLAARGARVTLVERAQAPGGKMREVRVDGRGIDSGPTVFTMRSVFEQLFTHAGADFSERVRLEPVEVLARHAWPDGSRLDLHADVGRSADAIGRLAGAREARAYRRFAQRSQAMFETLDESFMRREKPSPVGLVSSLGLTGAPRLLATKPYTSLWKELGRIFRDPRLRQLFGRYATYCGSSPFEAPATLMLIAHAERAGVWRVAGGMQRLAEALAALAESLGVKTHYGAEARELCVAAGRVSGVRLASGEELGADAVVFNGDVAALGAGLLGAGVREALPRRDGEARSLSAVTWSLVARVRGFPLAHHTVLFGEDYPDEFDAIFRRGEVTADPTVYLCAQDRDDGAAPDGEERLFALVNAPARPLDADALIAIETRFRRVLGLHGVDVDFDSARAVRTTPADFAARFPGSGGAIYGWPTHGWSGSFKRWGSRARLPGLYFAGGTVHPGPGVPMAALSGRIAAAAVWEDLSESTR